jgi:peptidoglycan/xylan/chitin deacetylase (PgdA/CDA1 family)
MTAAAKSRRPPDDGKPVFIVCIDFELAWGWAYNDSFIGREDRFLRGREAIPPLLDLFDEFEVPATWATVGHLFLESCRGRDGVAHPEIARPRFPWLSGDWYRHDPRSDVRSAPLWYASDLIAAIRGRSVGHELASHSFGHVPFGAPGCTVEAAESDLSAAVKAASDVGVSVQSFVYPQHRIGFTELLRTHGFTSYRGEDREPFLGLPSQIRKPLRLLVQTLGMASAPQQPEWGPDSLIHLPASLFFAIPERRGGHLITGRGLAARCIRGLRRAIERGGMHQIYFHDHNLGVRTEEFLSALRDVLSFASAARLRGELEILTMRDYAAKLTA